MILKVVVDPFYGSVTSTVVYGKLRWLNENVFLSRFSDFLVKELAEHPPSLLSLSLFLIQGSIP